QAIAAGMHVFEPETGDWNVAHAGGRLARAPVVLIEWARRQQGVILSPGAAGDVRTLGDLRGRRVALRQPAAGAAVLFAHLLDAPAPRPGSASRPTPQPAVPQGPPPGESEHRRWTGTERLDILLLGIDSGRRGEPTFLTDTMMVVSVDPQKGQLALISLPRDTGGWLGRELARWR
ncbi:MAG: substrate-binding domain-containing protein, partial [Dehalococcoidia bacterium]